MVLAIGQFREQAAPSLRRPGRDAPGIGSKDSYTPVYAYPRREIACIRTTIGELQGEVEKQGLDQKRLLMIGKRVRTPHELPTLELFAICQISEKCKFCFTLMNRSF